MRGGTRSRVITLGSGVVRRSKKPRGGNSGIRGKIRGRG